MNHTTTSFSQNGEDIEILNHCNKIGPHATILSIGENDGITLSNSYLSISKGYKAVLVEPDPVSFEKMVTIHQGNKNVLCLNWAIYPTDDRNYAGTVLFYRSGTLLGKGDQSLVSTMVLSEVEKWKKSGVEFTTIKVPAFHVYSVILGGRYDVISIDVEGVDLEILTEIDLFESGTSMVCIETNSIPEREKIAIDYCAKFGLTNVKRFGAENLIISKP